MNKSENLHEGHRERLINRFLAAPNAMADHELLEVLLFYFFPRVDTNPIAHRLLRVFGSLDAIMKASPQELMSVDGIGKKTATSLVVLGKLLERIIEERKASKTKRALSFYEIKNQIIEDFASIKEEMFSIYFLDKKLNKITSVNFNDGSVFKVSAEIPELAKAIAIHKPRLAVIAHNHPSGLCQPSEIDDAATKRIYLLCMVHGVELVDHLIVCGKQAFSYNVSHRLQHIIESANLNKIFSY